MSGSGNFCSLTRLAVLSAAFKPVGTHLQNTRQLRQPLSSHGFLADLRRAAVCQMALSATVFSVHFVSRPPLEVRLLLCMSPLSSRLSYVLEAFPSDLELAQQATLYKKGDMELPNNYRPIFLLRSLYKIYASIIQKHHAVCIEGGIWETQYGLRAKWSKADLDRQRPLTRLTV